MQAAKIKIGGEYAVSHNGKLSRFRVQSITTTRYAKKVANRVDGWIQNDGDEENTEASFKVEDVFGPYEEYAELVARKNAAEKAKEHEEKLRSEAGAQLWRDLYDAAGLPVPNDAKAWDLPFRLGYQSDEIQITRHGIGVLRKILDRLFENAA